MASTATNSPAVTEEARLIDRQLNVTRAQVRLVELGGAAVAWIVGVLVFLLAVILVDHWIMPLGSIGRALALLLLGGGSVAYFALVIWPLLRRQINPVYAARAIEESMPSLKNSLINFLLLKKDSAGTKEAILSAVEKRAAVDIATVPVELAVDRSHVIRLGYVLLAVVCFLALYKIQSPKDPFQTVARVFAPWANIAQPSRVVIRDVTPGDVRVYHGDTITVSCSVHGLHAGEPVEISYSSTDGQVLNQRVTMQLTSAGTRYEGELPAQSAERNVALRGVQQDLIYHLRAGDCVTSEYRVSVSPAPTIAVERLIYDYPAYTNKPLRTVIGQGDIQGLEGTRITLHARANQPIQTATLEFDPGDGSTAPAETLPMKVEGDVATVSFPLQLSSQQQPWRTTYQIRFYNTEGSRNPKPIVHRIDVTADMPPEIEWLMPQQLKIEVPADGQQRLELRAVDPDFGLRAIRLQADRGDQQLFNQSLLPAIPPSPPQATVPFDFIPSAWKLEEGDEVVVWGVAEDGRVSSLNRTPEPNVTKTERLVIRITAPTEVTGNGAPPKQPNAAQQPNDPQNPQQPPQPNQPQPDKQPKPGANDPQQPQPDNKQPPQAGEQAPKQPKPGDQQQENGGEQNSEPKNSQQPMKPQKPEESQQGTGEKEEGKQGGSKKEEKQEPMAGGSGEEKNGGGGSQSGEQSGPPQGGGDGGGQQGGGSDGKPMSSNNSGGDAEQGGSEGGSSADGGEGSGQDSGQSGGSKQEGQSGGQQSKSGGEAGDGDPAGGESNGDPTGAPNSRNSGSEGEGKPSSKPEHDGEVFDKVLDRLKNDPKHPKNNNASGKPAGERPAGDQRPPDGQAQQGEDRQPGAGEQNSGSNSPQGSNNPQTGSDPPGNSQKGESGESGSKKPGSADQKGGDPKDADQKNGDQQGTGRQPKDQPQSPMNGGQSGQSSNEGRGNSGQNKEGQPNGTGKPPQTPETKNEGEANQPGEEGAQPGAGANKKPELEEKKHGDGEQQNANPSEGGATQRNPRQPMDNPQSQGGQPGQPKDPGAGDNGQSGKGQNSDNKSGSANDQNEQQTQDRPKTGSADKGDGQKGEASPPGNSKKSSNSQGGESGDQKGGGKEGGGQSAGGAGNDSAGKNNAADQGAGKANEQGEGETGTKAGTQDKAEGQTGQSSGEQQGQGSESGKPPAGEQGQPGESKEPGKGSPTNKTPNSTNGGDGGKGGERGHVIGGGKSAEGNSGPTGPAPAGNVADGDEANLDYARRATDLVIDHLEDQEHNPDPELLQELGWSKDDLQKFVQRWKSLKESSVEKPAEKQELDESLRSLGLRPPKDKQRSGGSNSDQLNDVRDTGSRTSPPNRYRDQFEAFRKGVGR